MPKFEVIDAKDAPLLPGMTLKQMADGTYRLFMPGEPEVREWAGGRG